MYPKGMKIVSELVIYIHYFGDELMGTNDSVTTLTTDDRLSTHIIEFKCQIKILEHAKRRLSHGV